MNRAPTHRGELHHTIKNYYIMMNYQDKTKGELIKDLQKLQQEYDILKESYSKGITEGKQADDALRESEVRYKTLFSDAAEGVLVANTETKQFIYANPALCRMFGYSDKEIMGLGVKDIHPKESLDHVLAEFEAQMQGKKKVASDLPCLRKDGTLFYADVITSLIVLDGIKCLVGFFINITERKLAEETIRVLARFPSENPDPVLRVDQNGKLLYANEVSFKLLTWKLEIGKKIPPFLQKIISEVLKEGIGKIIETEHYQQVFSFSIVPVVEEGYVNLYGKDITSRNLAVQELALRNSGLLILNRFAIELSNLSSDDDLEALIIKQVKEIACAEVAIYAEYNSASRTTTTKHILMEDGLLEKVVKLLGKKIQDIHSVVSDEDYRAITTEMIGIRKTLYEASFGAIPRSVGAAIQALLKVDRIIGVAYMIEGKLYGTSVLLMGRGQPDPPREILENFIHLAALSLRRNKAEKALKENEERFRTLFENSTVGIYRTTPDGKILLANPTMVKILGYSSFEELSFRNLEEDGFEPSYERTHFMDIMKRNGEVKGLESVWTRKDGTKLFISESARAIHDKEGKIIYYDGIVEDITLRKQAEEALKENEEKFRSLMENSADAIFLTDKEGHYVYTNKAVTNMLGFTPEEMKSKTIIDLTPPGRKDEYLKLFSQLLNKGKLFTELDLIKKDGDVISTDFNSALFPGELVYGSCRDITEKKVIQNELIKHRNHLEELVNERTEKLRIVMDETRDLYENAPCGYHSLDENGKFVRINNTELKWLGYTRDEVIGRLGFKDLMTPASLEKFNETFSVFMKKGEISNLEFEFIRKDSTTFFVSLNATAIYDADGKFLKSRSTIFDITDRKVTEEKLNRAKKEAEEANRTKSEFLANMSHEIRTPMNAVLGYTELLGNTLVDQTQKDYINSIKSSGRSLLTLINDILDLSKIEAGKLELEYDFIDTYSFFSEFEKIFSLKVSEKGLKFILDISSGTPQGIYIDEARVRQIVFNLIGNAIKFTSEGKITLKVFTENPQIVNYSEEKSEELIDLIIEVQDTGIGVSKALQEAIFEPFIQERNFKHYGGTGLGLTISRRLTSLMDGTIFVRSKPGKGSIFTVRIPEIAYQRAFSGTNIEIQIDPAEIVFEEAVILIADDVEHNRSYLRDALKNTKLKIVEAGNGSAAYNIAKEILPDLIITDIRMPKMDGFQLLNKIKADKKLKHIPVIAYSASILKAQKERIHTSEFVGLLIKPVKVTELYLELMNILPYKSTRELEPVKLLPKVDLIGEITNLPELINSLGSDLYTTWKTFAVKQPIGGIRDFGSNLVQLGTHHNSSIMKDYGSELINAADNYNIVAILKLIGKYPSIIENLKDSSINKNNG